MTRLPFTNESKPESNQIPNRLHELQTLQIAAQLDEIKELKRELTATKQQRDEAQIALCKIARAFGFQGKIAQDCLGIGPSQDAVKILLEVSALEAELERKAKL